MKDFIIYIGLSGICIGIFFLVYRFFLRPSTFFGFNRAFLLIGLVTSFVLPLMRFSYEVLIPVSISSFDVPATTQAAPEAMNIDIWIILSAIYISGIIIQVFRNLTAYRKMIKLTKSGILTKTNSYKVVDSPQITSPFTILNCIAINTANMTEIEKDVILKHEITHISQKHWIDLLCSECALLLQWFNPLMWLYVSSLKENHEFLADKAVIEAGVSPALYQATLINQRFQGPVFSFSNSFNYPNQLNRLFMIKKTKTSPWRRAAVLALIPSFGLFFWASATPRYVFKTIENEPIEQVKDSVKVIGFGANPNDPIQVIGYSSDKTPTSPEKALYIIDGKESSYAVLKKMSPHDIESVSVLKSESSIPLYGEKAKNGAVLVTTKKEAAKIQFTPPVIEKEPLVIIDGKESTKKVFDNLDVDNIDNVTILKDRSAVEVYGKKAEGGAIIVTMKKGKGITLPPPPLPGKAGDFRLATDSITINSTQDGLILHNAKLNGPMIILDGKEISGESLQSIDPNKIERMEVFKNDDAIKKYGEKGKNGVILVTLKK